jgi:excinuclease ABC subunit C
MRSELLNVPGVGERTVEKLLQTIGSLEAVKLATESTLAREVGPAAARKIFTHFHPQHAPAAP